ncbi:MAG: ABC transporter ATP-binding protein [Clostridia bacterium]|nr:ABC transporter ATP-binding protein [Clostridia bacterium]
MITAENVTKRFGNNNALDGLSINVEKGSVYGLVGPNGAGKTTFIKVLMGVWRADSGSVMLDGEKIYENENAKRKIVYVSDDLFFYPAYTVAQTAKMYSEIYPNWDDALFKKLGEIFKIDLSRKVIRLSKGMQKQVAFWIGISCRPEVLILDEPIDGLDPVMRRNTWRLILSEVAERGMTVLISSHNLRELEDVCDHVGIVFKGKTVIEKSLDDVKGNIHKIQLAYNLSDGEYEKQLEKISQELEILHTSRIGSVSCLIIKGDTEKVKETIYATSPAIFDIIPLTLEEVFIYELGGMGYEFENILI